MLNQLSTLPSEAGLETQRQIFKRKCDSIDSKVAEEFGESLSGRCSSVDNDILSASDQNLENKIKPK